jgi:hypothetical protein
MISLLRHKDQENHGAEGLRHDTAGWYVDPFEPEKLRWFDGHRWTNRVIDGQRHAVPNGGRPKEAHLHSLGEGQARVEALLSGARRTAARR